MREVRRIFTGDRAQRPTGFLWLCFGVALVLALVPVSAGRSQVPGQNIGAPGTMHPYYPPNQRPFDNSDASDTVETERRLNALNVERRKEMVSDANKLLKLAREVNEEVAANGTPNLTIDQLHKIAQIENLARSVREKMADGTEPPTTAAPPVAITPH